MQIAIEQAQAPSLNQHKPFTLNQRQVSILSTMSPVSRDHELRMLAQRHHYESFPIIGVFASLTGRPQMQQWEAHHVTFMDEARAEYARAAETFIPAIGKAA